MGNDFDRWLEDELGRALSRIEPGYVAPRYLEARGPRLGRLLRPLAAGPALISAKVAAAGIVLVAAATTGVAVHSVASSGSNDPATWGQKVVQQVQKCKAELGADQHGIGQCVSNFAKQNGDNQSDQNGQGGGAPSGTPTGEFTSHPTPQGKGQGVTGDHPTPPAHPTPAAHPTAPPHPTPKGTPNGNAGSGNNNAGGNGGGQP